ncbi:LAME_0F11298g1_1 [Lachancea meyersii CBS 8951]|uniref:LAME_0F11298g1_1 n=1 Tax=Lachancea meyersii CBS 8951 TaxID=1266667 RepID=A0A1G4JW05_9SACH|nr:LAME_0F11298g1_1 [Lachancea meyersii CBS 8951]
MPGQFISVPFLSQAEDMDKYLMEYRSLKLMPQSAASSQQQQQQQQQQQNRYSMQNRTTITGNQAANLGYNNANNGRKKLVGNNNSATQGYRLGNKNGFNKVSHQQQLQLQMQQQQQQQQQAQQHAQPQAQQPLQGAGFKQAFPQMFYGSANGSNSSLAQQALTSQVYAPSNAGQQQLMTASSSSSSTPPPRLHVSVSGTSSISSLGGDFDYLLPNELNGHLMPSASTQISSNLNGAAGCSTNNIANSGTSQGLAATNAARSSTTALNMMQVAPLSGGFLNSVSTALPSGFNKMENELSSSNDFISGLPSSLLSEGSTAPEFSGLSGRDAVFSNPSAESSRSFMLPNSKSWGAGNVNSSSTAGSSGIWSNDMSVWS